MIVYGRIVLFFISLLGLRFVSGIVWLILCCYYELDRWVCRSVIGVCGRVCTYCSLLNVCEREREKKAGSGVSFSGSVLGSRCASALCLCSSLCQCVQVFPCLYIRSSKWKRKREREREEEEEEKEEAEGLFPSGGKKTQMRKDTFEKRIFFSSAGSQRRV